MDSLWSPRLGIDVTPRGSLYVVQVLRTVCTPCSADHKAREGADRRVKAEEEAEENLHNLDLVQSQRLKKVSINDWRLARGGK